MPQGTGTSLFYATGLVLSFTLLGAQPAIATHCSGDCNDDGRTNVSEIIRCVRMALDAGSTGCDSCDRNANGRISVSELIQAVIAALSGCPPKPTPTITDTPTTIGSPTPSATNTAPPTRVPTPIPMGCRAPNEGEAIVCGDGICMTPENCDLGGICVDGPNNGHSCTRPDHCPGGRCTVVGGQPIPNNTTTCSANCTFETERTARISDSSTLLIQTQAFQIGVDLSGTHSILTGEGRPDDTIDINGETTYAPGDIPITTKASGLEFNPTSIPPLVCLCIDALEHGAFGPGNSGAGVASCGRDLPGTGYRTVVDHRTDPIGEDFTPVEGCAMPPDPECTATSETAPGLTSHACREGIDSDCRGISSVHTGTCNSPKVTTRSGSAGPRGSAFLWQNLSISLLADSGRCAPSDCRVHDYGPDCIPCTDDDRAYREIDISPLTTGTANAVLWNAGSEPGEIISEGSQTPCEDLNHTVPCQTGSQCGIQEVCRPTMIGGSLACGIPCGGQTCRTTEHGTPFSCSQLQSQDNNQLTSGALALSWPAIDGPTIGDTVTTLRMEYE